MFYAAFSLEFCVWLRTLVFDEAGLVGIQGEPAIIVLICSFPIWHKFHFFFFWRASSRILCLSLWFLGVCQENDKRKCKRSETQVQNGQKQGKGAQIKKLATSIFQKKVGRVFWNKPTSLTGGFFNKTVSVPQWINEGNTFLIPLCRSLAIFELQMFFWGSHPFCCKPATGAFGVCVVCVVHLETWFLTRSCTQALFCLHYQQHELRKGFLGFAFFCARSELCWCLVCSCKIPPRCLVMVSLLGMWTPDGCFGVRNRTTHCFWHVLSLARSGA